MKFKTQTRKREPKFRLLLVTADTRGGRASTSVNAVGWKVRIVDPARMTLEYQGTVWGYTMTGNMKAGRFGAWPFVGRRQ